APGVAPACRGRRTGGRRGGGARADGLRRRREDVGVPARTGDASSASALKIALSAARGRRGADPSRRSADQPPSLAPVSSRVFQVWTSRRGGSASITSPSTITSGVEIPIPAPAL